MTSALVTRLGQEVVELTRRVEALERERGGGRSPSRPRRAGTGVDIDNATRSPGDSPADDDSKMTRMGTVYHDSKGHHFDVSPVNRRPRSKSTDDSKGQSAMQRSLSLPHLGPEPDRNILPQSELEEILAQYTDEITSAWDMMDGGNEQLMKERREAATWRAWARHQQRENPKEPLKLPRRGFKRWVFGGVIAGALLVLAAMPHVTQSAVPAVLVDAASYQLMSWLNATLNATGMNAAEENAVDESLPGLHLAARLSPKHPVMMIPGFVTSGLEIWRAGRCLGSPNAFFRRRFWTGTSFIRHALQNTSCWLEHMSLHPETGLDPPDIKLRAAQGLDAADYFFPGYWIWGKVIENLATIGYDTNNMIMESYDWRLKFDNMEERDQVFTRFQLDAERMVEATGEKVVTIGHSMGVTVWLYFQHWVTHIGRSGKGDPGWVDRHIHAFVNIGGPVLGAMAPITALLSGEAHLGAMGSTLEPLSVLVLGEKGKAMVKDVVRTWGSVAELLPSGGDAVWGTEQDPTDCKCNVLTRKNNKTPMGADDVREFIKNITGVKTLQQTIDRTGGKHSVPYNNFEVPLPHAPNMTIFCLYGVGLPTERAYWYNEAEPNSSTFKLDYNSHDKKTEYYAHGAFTHSKQEYGLSTTDGDGTVPLVSLGYMCRDGWRKDGGLNPSGTEVVTREYVDYASSVLSGDVRGGPATSKHVEILGNHKVIRDILDIVAHGGRDDEVRMDVVHSRIDDISQRVRKRRDKLEEAAKKNQQAKEAQTQTAPQHKEAPKKQQKKSSSPKSKETGGKAKTEL